MIDPEIATSIVINSEQNLSEKSIDEIAIRQASGSGKIATLFVSRPEGWQ